MIENSCQQIQQNPASAANPLPHIVNNDQQEEIKSSQELLKEGQQKMPQNAYIITNIEEKRALIASKVNEVQAAAHAG